MTRAAIIQPNYLPWRGYFDIIHDVDVFVFLDDVQYTPRDWRNRNRIRRPDGSLQWLTVPVVHDSRTQLIHETRVDPSQDWQHKHLEAMRHAYGRQEHFRRYFEELDPLLRRPAGTIADLDIRLTEAVCGWLGITTRLVRASSLAASGDKADRLIDLLLRLGADAYLSGPAARAYIQPDQFSRAGIALEYKSYEGYPTYPQVGPGFEPGVSVIDLLFCTGPAAPDHIWGWR